MSCEWSAWTAKVHETPTKNHISHESDGAEEPVIGATSIYALTTHKASKISMNSHEADGPSSQSRTPEVSIFTRLGWDDEADELGC